MRSVIKIFSPEIVAISKGKKGINQFDQQNYFLEYKSPFSVGNLEILDFLRKQTKKEDESEINYLIKPEFQNKIEEGDSLCVIIFHEYDNQDLRNLTFFLTTEMKEELVELISLVQ